MPGPQRLSLRHINKALRHLARQHAAGDLDLATYRAQRDALLDHLASPAVLAMLIDDAPTETGARPVGGPSPSPRRHGLGRFLPFIAALLLGPVPLLARHLGEVG